MALSVVTSSLCFSQPPPGKPLPAPSRHTPKPKGGVLRAWRSRTLGSPERRVWLGPADSFSQSIPNLGCNLPSLPLPLGNSFLELNPPKHDLEDNCPFQCLQEQKLQPGSQIGPFYPPGAMRLLVLWPLLVACSSHSCSTFPGTQPSVTSRSHSQWEGRGEKAKVNWKMLSGPSQCFFASYPLQSPPHPCPSSQTPQPREHISIHIGPWILFSLAKARGVEQLAVGFLLAG